VQLQFDLCPSASSAQKGPVRERWGGLGPLLARAGRRVDYRRRDEWGDPITPSTGLLDRIGALMPVSYSGVILLICILVFFLGYYIPIVEEFVQNYLILARNHALEMPWTILTYMFVHGGFNHLFFNMLFLFFFGMELERRVGPGEFLQIYILSGIFAALAQMAVSSVPMVGASGALYGVLGCLAIIAPEIRLLLFFMIPMSIRWAVVLFALIDLLFMGSADNIAHMAHIAGLVVGLAFGQMMKGQAQYYYR
jgi:membrane associated rhomboid family serine protease